MADDTPAAPQSLQDASASALLDAMLHAFPDEKIRVDALIDHLDDRGYGLVLLVLALPMCVPNLPGISTVFGILMLPPALGLMLGARRMWLPGFLGRREIDRTALAGTVRAAGPMVRRFETWFRPRLAGLTAPPFTVLLGVQVLILALVLILPIPGGNWPPGIAVAMTGLALLQRDGLLALASFVIAAIALAVAAWVVWFIVTETPALWDGVMAWLGLR
jgi:hypothetical protein